MGNDFEGVPAQGVAAPTDDTAPTGSRELTRRISLRSSLLLLVLVCILPGIALCSYLIYANYLLQKQKVVGETQLIAGQVLADLDRELAAIESGLKVLATADTLKDGDLRRFHQIARSALKSQSVLNYVLTDPNGRQLINTSRPYGASLPSAGTPPQLDEVIQSGNTVLTDLFLGPVTGAPIIAMGVPVYDREGRIVYSLNVGMLPRQIGEILKRHPLPDGWLVAIVDSTGTIVARSRDAERFVGQKAVPELAEQILKERSGTLDTISKEGIPVSTAYVRSPAWNWTVAAGAPKAVLEAGMASLFLWLGVAVLILVAAGSWLARHISLRVVSSVHYLNQAALALREGKPVAVPRVELQEAEAVGQAIVQASHLMAKVRHRAYHDPLTELGNRSMFYEIVQHQLAIAEREGKQLAVLAIDLDKFKLVNDEEGHAAGDHLLASVARRIENTIRATDAAARMGGDEFSILLVDVDERSAEETAQRLLSHLAEPYDGIRTPVSASIGIAIYPDAGKDLAELLENADRALYAAKRGGRNAACRAGVRPTLH